MQPRQPQPGRPNPARPTNVDKAFQGQAPSQPAAPKAVDTRSLFRRAQERVSATREDGSSKFINAEVKQRWLDNVTPLYLHKLLYRANGRFGAEWTLHLSEDDPANPVYFANFKANDYRDVFFPELQSAIDSSGQPLGPLMLTVHHVEGQANPSWDIQPWDPESAVGF